MVYACVVSATVAKGSIAALDEAAARGVPGVAEILTRTNRPHIAWRDGNDQDAVAPPGSQNVQACAANTFGFSKDKVRVLSPYVGGGFGTGLRPRYQVYPAAVSAKLLERSVRLVLTRQQVFTHVHGPEATRSVRLGNNREDVVIRGDEGL